MIWTSTRNLIKKKKSLLLVFWAICLIVYFDSIIFFFGMYKMKYTLSKTFLIAEAIMVSLLGLLSLRYCKLFSFLSVFLFFALVSMMFDTWIIFVVLSCISLIVVILLKSIKKKNSERSIQMMSLRDAWF